MSSQTPFIPTTHSLTEDEVKRRFVPFLREFYKNRYEPMPNSVAVELDNVSREGWVADGKISFRKSDGAAFVCTYEATSRDKAEEVKYQLNTQYLLWDCAAFGMVCAALGYTFFYRSDFTWLAELGVAGNLGLVLGVGLIGFFGWYFVVQNWRKYRYIYAIQQFKQYFADEQWVALAEDVFPAPSDPYLLELRNQCVYHGIGLAIVPFDGPVRKVIDPSRLGIFGKDRKMTQWVTRAEWYQAFSQNVSNMAARRPKAPDALTALWNRIFRPVHYLVLDPLKRLFRSKPVGHTSAAYTRFMSAQSVQKWITALAFLLTSLLCWNVMTISDEKIADLKDLQLRKNGKNPEDLYGPQIEGEIIPADGEPTGVPKQFPISKKQQLEEEDGNTIDLSGDDDEEENEEETPVKRRVTKPATKPKTALKPVVKNLDGCALLRKTDVGWLVQDNAFQDQSRAEARAKLISSKGIECYWADQNCLMPGRQGWLVWMGKPFPNKTSATEAAENYKKAFQRYGISNGKFWVRAR
jgi:hypothetical protein